MAFIWTKIILLPSSPSSNSECENTSFTNFSKSRLTDGVKTRGWALSDTPYLNQLFSQKVHELHQLQLQGRLQEEPNKHNSLSEWLKNEIKFYCLKHSHRINIAFKCKRRKKWNLIANVLPYKGPLSQVCNILAWKEVVVAKVAVRTIWRWWLRERIYQTKLMITNTKVHVVLISHWSVNLTTQHSKTPQLNIRIQFRQFACYKHCLPSFQKRESLYIKKAGEASSVSNLKECIMIIVLTFHFNLFPNNRIQYGQIN